MTGRLSALPTPSNTTTTVTQAFITDASPEGAQRIADVLAGRIAVLVEDLEEPEGFGPAALNARTRKE